MSCRRLFVEWLHAAHERGLSGTPTTRYPKECKSAVPSDSHRPLSEKPGDGTAATAVAAPIGMEVQLQNCTRLRTEYCKSGSKAVARSRRQRGPPPHGPWKQRNNSQLLVCKRCYGDRPSSS